MNSITSDKVRELGFGGRKFQLDAYNKFNGKRFTINVSPTGSGKSLVQVFCAAREIIESDYKQKQVFIVPQLDIGNGFSDHKHEYLKMNGKIYEWETTNNFCSDSKDSVKKIKKFLTTNIDCSDNKTNNIIGGVTAVVSYSALVHAFKSMTKKEKLKMIENTSFRIDEGHHVCGVEDDFVPNKMGEITKFILDNDGHYHITTATLFRGDYQPIVGRDYLKKFSIFRVPFLDHWNTLGIDKLNYNFESYQSAEDLFKKIVSNIKKNPQQRPMIILPADKQKYFKYENKWYWTKKLVSELEKVFGKGKVLDLISDDTQDASKARLAKSEQDFYAIVTCSIGREGTDWPACNYVHNTTLDSNLVLAIQKLGRVMRQYAGKTQVYFTNYIEHFPKWDSDTEDIRCRLSDRFNAIFASNMIDDLFSPVVMPKLPKKKQESDDNQSDDSDDTEDTASLDDVFGPVKGEVVEEIMNEVWKIKQNDLSPDKVEKIIEEIIEKHNDDILVDVDFESLKDRLMLEVARIQDPKEEKLKIKGCIVDFIREGGWDKIIRKSLKEGSPFVGSVDAIDLNKLQEFLSRNDKASYEEHIEFAKKHAYSGNTEYDDATKPIEFYSTVGNINEAFNKNFSKDMQWKTTARPSYEEHMTYAKRYNDRKEYNSDKDRPKMYYSSVDIINNAFNKNFSDDMGWTKRKHSYSDHISFIKKKGYKSVVEYDSDNTKSSNYYSSARAIMKAFKKNLPKDMGWTYGNIKKASYSKHILFIKKNKYKNCSDYNHDKNKPEQYYCNIKVLNKVYNKNVAKDLKWDTTNNGGWGLKRHKKLTTEMINFCIKNNMETIAALKHCKVTYPTLSEFCKENYGKNYSKLLSNRKY